MNPSPAHFLMTRPFSPCSFVRHQRTHSANQETKVTTFDHQGEYHTNDVFGSSLTPVSPLKPKHFFNCRHFSVVLFFCKQEFLHFSVLIKPIKAPISFRAVSSVPALLLGNALWDKREVKHSWKEFSQLVSHIVFAEWSSVFQPAVEQQESLVR